MQDRFGCSGLRQTGGLTGPAGMLWLSVIIVPKGGEGMMASEGMVGTAGMIGHVGMIGVIGPAGMIGPAAGMEGTGGAGVILVPVVVGGHDGM